ncbi:MAG TPA: electron transport complex subunit RsxE, partial [Spirochaetota bacterium]|nr:electron transport complex subunit RsxE [Spirochaetota bacterium]
NPVFVLLLGLCPTLAITTSLANGIGMGIAATFVLLGSNILVSSLKNFIPDKIRIPSYIVIVASFVTIADMLINAFVPALAKSLGVFIPLLVVNCIMLGRAEAFACKNKIINSIFDALGMGLGFTIAICIIGIIREILGTCSINFTDLGVNQIFLSKTGAFTINLFNKDIDIYKSAMVLISPAGAFIVVGVILGFINWFRILREKKEIK